MSDPVQDLEKARSSLVDMRRQWVSVLAGPYQRGKTGDAIKELIQIQKAIEAIDAAIPEEHRASAPKSGKLKNFPKDNPFSEDEPGG
jgi:signal transduction histidine kinase